MLRRLVGECLEESNEGFFVVNGQRHAAVGMFREIRIEGRAAFRARAIVVNDFFQRLETPVVHVGTGQRDVAEGGDGEFSLVQRVAG